jgi:hypothetical protein
MNRLFRRMQCDVNVPKSTVSQASRRGIIFFTIGVASGFSQQVGRFVQTTTIISRPIGGRRIVGILAIIDGGTGQFSNRTINLADGLTFVRGHCGITRAMFEHPSRRTQIRYRM